MPTERSQRREVMLGAAAVAAGVILFLGIFFLADVKRIFTRTDTLYALTPSAAGLQPGALVWVAGRTVGEVKDIRVRPPGTASHQRVLIRFEVERRYREHIRRDSDVRIRSARLIGEQGLDISPGSSAAPQLEEGDTLGVRQVAGPAIALERARTLQAGFAQLLADARSLGGASRRTIQQTNRLRKQLDITLREFTDFVEAMQQGPLNTFSDPQFNQTLASVGKSIGELQKTFQRAGERARKARNNAGPAFDRLAARADTIQMEIANLQAALNTGGGGILVRAQQDSAIFKGLNRARAQLDSLVTETKSNPLRFWF